MLKKDFVRVYKIRCECDECKNNNIKKNEV